MPENTLRRHAYESAAQAQFQDRRREARTLPPPENLPTLPDSIAQREIAQRSNVNMDDKATRNRRDFLANIGIEDPENLIVNNPDILNLSQSELEEKIISTLTELIKLDSPLTINEVVLKTPSLFRAAIDATEATAHD